MLNIDNLSRLLKHDEEAFTLVELMVVVVIIGVLVSIAVPIYNEVTVEAERVAVEANLRTIDSAIMQAQAFGDNYDDIEALEGDYFHPIDSVGNEEYKVEDGRAVVSGEVGGYKLNDDHLGELPWNDED